MHPRYQQLLKSKLKLSLCTSILVLGGGWLPVHAQEASSAKVSATEPAAVATRSVAVLQGESLFGFDSDELSASGIASLDKLVDQLALLTSILSIRVIGHTDATGPATYNKWLSNRRAMTIAKLIKQRFPNVNLVAIGNGETTPVANNDSPQGRRLNRRVELEIVAIGEKLIFEE